MAGAIEQVVTASRAVHRVREPPPAPPATPETTATGGRLSQETSPVEASTKYAHDATGAVTSVTDRAGNVSDYSYDGIGRQATITYPMAPPR